MGISRDSIHKKRLTGGKKRIWRKKRKHEIGRQGANTKIGIKQIAKIRVRGGNVKNRALKLDHGNFSLISIAITKKTRILSVVYNSSNNELVRTNTLVKGAIIFIDSSPFKNWAKQNNYIFPKEKKIFKNDEKNSPKNLKKEKETNLWEQINSGKVLARICSRPGQTGRSDGYILEGSELEFYIKKIHKKKL
ncbi:rps8 (nucleomorph) [Hemiselmis andersenii]|uniref:40S ribosomal protein S8 n=1 Tax=Hemiselmis andersenii TaxID=464988 RepID=A9BL76_HEMAN|nr:rps8 [Hemiselmis andersenii]ABW98259.1 rps8 [Hemiselmis andersenii]|mmetsp:Transcript_10044/g.23483  ORF Transcript_10044/g.23483 Transcript_10044/m.23483 type:complete len:192 (+) Transcript_10044:1041-1616(+)